MNAQNLQPQRSERVYSALQIAVFSIIVLMMLVFLVMLIYQWYSRPATFTTVASIKHLVASTYQV